jgi:hypothetical protein
VVEISIDNGAWNQMTKGYSNWSWSIDTTRIENGPIRLRARAFDGVAYSAIAWVDVQIRNAMAGAPFFIQIVSPEINAEISAPFVLRGNGSAGPGGQTFIEYYLEGAPWIQASSLMQEDGSWAIEFPGPLRKEPIWDVCVRASQSDLVSNVDCRQFRAPISSASNSPPSVSIEVLRVAGAEACFKLEATGNASDDLQVLAVFFRISGGDWRQATGTDHWMVTRNCEFEPGGRVLFEVRAFDGQNFSDVRSQTIELSKNPPQNDGFLATIATDWLVWLAVALLVGAGGALWVRNRRR